MATILGLLFSAVVLWFAAGWTRRELAKARHIHGSLPEPDRPLTAREKAAWDELCGDWL